MVDRGRELNDKELARLERELAREYRTAKKEMQEKLDKQLKQFDALDTKKQKLVDSGKMTEDEYGSWRKTQLTKSKWMRSLIDRYSTDLVKVDKKATDIINNRLPNMYAESFNHGTYEIEKGSRISTSFTLYNKNTVKRLMSDKGDLYAEAKLDVPKDKRWNQQSLRSAVTQGVLQGEGMDKIAKRMANVTDMDAVSAIRNARTLTTGAESNGKLDSYYRAREMGIPIKKMWQAFLDDRTRASHRHLDGETKELEEPFSNGLQYPGDTSTGEGREYYNCRCNLSSQITGFERDMSDLANRSNKLGDMSYEEWKEDRKTKAPTTGSTQQGDSTKGYDSFEKSRINRLMQYSPEPIRNLWNKYASKLQEHIEVQGRGYYEPKDGKVRLNSSKTANGGDRMPFQTHFHEYAHSIDFLAGNGTPFSAHYKNADGKTLGEVIMADWSDSMWKYYKDVRYMKEFYSNLDISNGGVGAEGYAKYLLAEWRRAKGISRSDYEYVNIKDAIDKAVTEDDYRRIVERNIDKFAPAVYNEDDTWRDFTDYINKSYTLKERGNLSDMAGGYSLNHGGTSRPFGFGHEEIYIEHDYNQCQEAFADMVDEQIANKKARSLTEKYLPNAVKMHEEMMEEMVK